MNKYLTLLVMGFIAPLHASQVLENQIINCQSITSNEQRLACFDRIELVVAKSAAPVATPVATAVAESASSAVATAPYQATEEFGLEHKRVQQAVKKLDKLSLKLKSVKTNKRDLLVFTFTNGQVWRQSSKEFFSPQLGATFQIQRGALGAFYLNKKGTNRKIRVVREQ